MRRTSRDVTLRRRRLRLAMALQAGILGLVEGRRLRRMGVQETLWHKLFLRRQGASLLVYSLVLDSDRRLEPEMVHGALAALQR